MLSKFSLSFKLIFETWELSGKTEQLRESLWRGWTLDGMENVPVASQYEDFWPGQKQGQVGNLGQ